MITGAQIRAARALVGITANELAARSGVSHVTISRLEKVDGISGAVRLDTLLSIKKALEEAGVTFLGENDTTSGGYGVRFHW